MPYEDLLRKRAIEPAKVTFRFLEAALPESYKEDIDRLQKLRRKRNRAVYETRGIVTEKEIEYIVELADRFFGEIIGLMPEEYGKSTK